MTVFGTIGVRQRQAEWHLPGSCQSSLQQILLILTGYELAAEFGEAQRQEAFPNRSRTPLDHEFMAGLAVACRDSAVRLLVVAMDAKQRSPDIWFFVEIHVPESIIPLQSHVTPSQWDLWVRIERTNVRKSTGTVLCWIGDRC